MTADKLNSFPASGEFLGHPRGLFVCFATEMWERFSFYGMKYLLLLYLTKYHLFSDSMGLDVLGSYAGMVYAMPVLGGLLADRYLGMRKSVVFGGCLLVLGHLGMAYEGTAAHVVADKVVRDENAIQVLYFSLALIVVGVGFLKPNISTIVGKLYDTHDPRRDGGFTIFYMGINMGAFAATLLCGYLGETWGWAWGFGAAGVGMVIGLVIFLRGQHHLLGHAEPTNPEKLKQPIIAGLSLETTIYAAGALAVFVLWQMLQVHAVVETGLNLLSLAVLGALAWFLIARCDKVERERMLVLIVLIISSVFFWALFAQSAGSMTLFADRVTDKQLFGVPITASQFGSLNPFFIFTLAPVFAWLWTWLGRRGLEPGTPVKFSLGILQAGLGFGALVMGASTPDESGRVAAMWLVLAYLLHTTGELCLSPVGLSAVTRLAVPGVVGVMMGTWFLASAYSEFAAAQISKLAALPDTPGETTDISAMLASYSDLFGNLLYVGVGMAVVMLLLSPLLRKWMHGIH